MKRVSAWFLALTVLALTQTIGCTLKATTDTTLDATSNFLSSTTPGAWVTEDGLFKAEYKVAAFTALNQSNLEQDIARSHGEYLTSVATLLGVGAEQRAAFEAKAQEGFGSFAAADFNGRVEQLRALAR